jgi:hypothetical protein
MAKITKEKYKEDLRLYLKEEIVKTYKKDDSNKGLRYWVEWNKEKKQKFDDDLKAKGDVVV